MSELAIDNMTANIDFDATISRSSLPVTLPFITELNPARTISSADHDLHAVTGKLRVNDDSDRPGGISASSSSASPDLPDVAYPPLLGPVENYRGVQLYDVIAPKLAVTGVTYTPVNQQLPILLSWSPKGLARSYQFQMDEPGLRESVVECALQTEAY